MTKSLKKILYKLLGEAAYLKALHVSFFILYDTGILKRNYIYKYHYFIKKIIKPGDCIIDIGGNLGYLTKIFSRLTGSAGKVISIEPVKPFFQTLKWALRNKKNCTIYNYALGAENKKITITLPKIDGFFRTGLAHIAKNETDREGHFNFEVEMIKGSELLINLPTINYIKIDIEGYEEFVLPELKEVFIKFKPILQIETAYPQKEIVFALMTELGYVQYGVYKNKLVKNLSEEVESGDYLFVHQSKEAAFVLQTS